LPIAYVAVCRLRPLRWQLDLAWYLSVCSCDIVSSCLAIDLYCYTSIATVVLGCNYIACFVPVGFVGVVQWSVAE
jgi:hypothetical protein